MYPESHATIVANQHSKQSHDFTLQLSQLVSVQLTDNVRRPYAGGDSLLAVATH
jgi:hypothetical protein